MKNAKKFTTIVLVAAIITVMAATLVACGNNGGGQSYDPETRPFAMSISTPDGVFNPFFSTSAYDSSIVGMTQIGMLSTDAKGNIVCGDNEPTVTKDYTIAESEEGGKKYTTYEFLIKNGIKFSDGHDLTIKDVLFNLYTYLDPSYAGSATIYSTDIVGLKNYRQQQISTSDSTAFEEQFVSTANVRIDTLIEYVMFKYAGTKPEDRPADRWTEPGVKEQLEKDIQYVADTFRKELTSDWNNVDLETYRKDSNFTDAWQVFMLNDGGMNELLLEDPEKPGHKYKDENGNYKLDKTEADEFYNDSILPYVQERTDLSKEEAIKEYCISSVYTSYFKLDDESHIDLTKTSYTNFETVVKYWQTAATVLDQFTAEAKSEYFKGNTKVVPNISGITTHKVTNFNGKNLGGEHDVLSIKINDVDPKAIYNFAFTVAPLHYYSGKWNGKDYVAAFDGKKEFGLEFGEIKFMNEVINAPNKVGLPMGAGTYKASNANGSGNVTSDTFFNNNMVYYERNPYFETLGSGISNAKIKYVRYKVVESDQIINALTNGDIDFGEPSATQENIGAVSNAGLGHVEIATSGYGYVGINPRFVPNINVRRAIIKAMKTSMITDNYYKGGLAEIIYRPMSKTSWAYPKEATVFKSADGTLDYSYDSTGSEIKQLVEDAGYVFNGTCYEKTIEGFGVDKLDYKLTIAGGSVDHPAYSMFLNAAKILNSAGFDVKVVTSQTALSDLSAGKLAIWAAAWSSTIDPDMYQVYHMDSQASSTSNWGYKQIKAGKSTEAYATEYQIITELSELIDQGRATTDQNERKSIYAQALDKIMEFAVEMPTYQRNDMSAYNKNVLDEGTMTPAKDRSPYNGLLSRIWELNYR